MGSTDVLSRSVQRRHEMLVQELEGLRQQFGPPGEHEELEGPHRAAPRLGDEDALGHVKDRP